MGKIFDAKIYYTIDDKHPDYVTLPENERDKPLDFGDLYCFDEEYYDEECLRYIKDDLRLVAGDGYNSKHIHNVVFSIFKR